MRKRAQGHRASRQARGRSLPISVPVFIILAKGFVGKGLALRRYGAGSPRHHHHSPSSTALLHFLAELLVSGQWLLPTPEDPGPSDPPLSCQPPLDLSHIFGLNETFPTSIQKLYLELLSSGLHFPFSPDHDGRERGSPETVGCRGHWGQETEGAMQQEVSLPPPPSVTTFGQTDPRNLRNPHGPGPALSLGLSAWWCPESR